MSWILFTIIAIVIWTVVNIMDKYIIGHEVRDPVLVTTVFGLTIYLLFILFGLINGHVLIPWTMILVSMLGGLLYSVGTGTYYLSMKKIEVSRLVPILAIEPLIIAVASFFLFAERLTLMNYVGIIAIVLGAIIISHKKSISKVTHKGFLILPFVAMGMFAFRNILIKYITLEISFWPMLFWFGVGGLLVPLILLIFHHPHIREKAKSGIIHLCFIALLSGLALISFTKAISIGSVSLVSALMSTKPMLVFFVATFLSFFYPKIILERHSRAVLLKKTVAIALIVAGGIFIVI
ncbi:EamA family transporter [Candidatus Kuenenbacteria bacterium]|nr:EamA family transporter [Candidatus Kuenenbacteria bacterium]